MYSSTFSWPGTSWRWVVSFTPLPLYPRYPFYRMLGGPQSQSGRYGEVKMFVPTGTRTPASLVVQPVASRYTDWTMPAHTPCSIIILITSIKMRKVEFRTKHKSLQKKTTCTSVYFVEILLSRVAREAYKTLHFYSQKQKSWTICLLSRWIMQAVSHVNERKMTYRRLWISSSVCSKYGFYSVARKLPIILAYTLVNTRFSGARMGCNLLTTLALLCATIQ
jgi:hypothetical protein